MAAMASRHSGWYQSAVAVMCHSVERLSPRARGRTSVSMARYMPRVALLALSRVSNSAVMPSPVEKAWRGWF